MGGAERGKKMDIREVDLPGIGRKYCMNTRSGAAIIAVVEAGKRKVLNPGPELSFSEGSTLVGAGDAKQFNALKRLMSEDALIK